MSVMNRVESPAVDADLSQIKIGGGSRPRSFRFSRCTTPSTFERMESDSSGQLPLWVEKSDRDVCSAEFPTVAAVYDRRIERSSI